MDYESRLFVFNYFRKTFRVFNEIALNDLESFEGAVNQSFFKPLTFYPKCCCGSYYCHISSFENLLGDSAAQISSSAGNKHFHGH